MAMIKAAKGELRVSSLAAVRLFDKKPHLGHQLSTAELYPGIGLANSNTTTGLPVCLYDSVSRSRSWNRYAYALNDPLRFVDPTGTTCQNSQVDNGDGTFTDSVVDDGDGQGCAAVGVAATNNGSPPVDASDIQAQQINVSAQQGSLLDYLWATSTNDIPIYVENDLPLNPSAQRILGTTGAMLPTVCGGGGFVFLGAQGNKKGATGFAGGIVEYDSKTGLSGGGLFEAGKKGGSGVGAIAGPAGGQGLLYVPVFEAGVAEGGLVGFSSGIGAYGEVGHGPLGAGGGLYVNVTTNAGCAGVKKH